ncbi:MAG: isocitrate/isopropylmalate dehydrogenase family protein [Clostridiales bacterium]|nr:isocitrate/isopropylmalate dehydrogenase family protein [Clostridiales bacterium]
MNQEAIEQAVAHYRELLLSQVARAERMNAAPAQEKREKTVIGIIGGDGIGPIITAQAEKALQALLKDEIQAGRIELRTIEGLTIENRLAVGQAVPDDVLAAVKECDVLLKGPTTTPSGGTMESANVALRRELDLFANIRPVSVPEEGIDWMFFRENTEGEYTLGSKGIELPGLLTMDFKVTTIAGTRRIARAAFEYAKNNGKTHVAIVTKSNIMKKTDGMFSAVCHEVAADYPDIQVDEYFIDIMSANLLKPALRQNLQVFVMPNLYGDIITDEAAQIQGGVGTAGSANAGDRYAMFEAIHGSAPRMIARGMGDYANPESILRAAVMLLRHIGMPAKADQLDAAIGKAIAACPITGTREGHTCQEFGDALAALL